MTKQTLIIHLSRIIESFINNRSCTEDGHLDKAYRMALEYLRKEIFL